MGLVTNRRFFPVLCLSPCSSVKLRDFQSAVNNFEKALEKAKLVHNNNAQQAIISALDDANKGIIDELKKTNYRDLLKEKKEKEEAAELDNTTVTREKETVRSERGRPEKVIKQWERRQTESEKDTEEELSNGAFTTTGSEEEEKRQRKKGSSLRREQGVMGRDSGDIARRMSRELAIKRSGEAGGKLIEVSQRESREIYRRPSDLDQKFSEDLIGRQLEEVREKLSEDYRGESEEPDEIKLGEIGELKTENAGKREKGEKEDE